MNATTASVGAPTTVRKRLRKSPFFTILGLLMLVFAIAGFWPQYFSAVTGQNPAATTQFWLIHVHAALFVGWLLIYISQASLIFAGRARIHIALGPWLAIYGFVIAAIGVFAALRLAVRFGERVGNFEEAAAFVFYPLIDMVYLAGFLAAAVIFRKRPDLHKRAMFLATYSIATVGGGRFVERMVGLDSAWVWQSLMLAPLLLAIGYDLLVCRRMYAIMTVGLAVHFLRLNAEPFTKSEWWLPLGRILIAPFR